MTEEQNNQNTQTQGNGVPAQGNGYQVPQAPQIPQTQGTQTSGMEQLKKDHPQAPQTPAPEPVNLSLMTKYKQYVYTDKNGYEWSYRLQFPGMKKLIEMYDESRSAAGGFSNSILYPLYFKYVIVEPAGLTIDTFDNRPGLFELMEAVESFLEEAQE